MQNTRNSAFTMSKSEVICTGGSYIAPVIVVSELVQRSVIALVFRVCINSLTPAFLYVLLKCAEITVSRGSI